jgi:GT2 family glycosyltransferase
VVRSLPHDEAKVIVVDNGSVFMACGAVVRREAFLACGGFDDIVFFVGKLRSTRWPGNSTGQW